MCDRTLHKMHKNWRTSATLTSGKCATDGLFAHHEVRALDSLDRLMLPMSPAGTGSFILNQLLGNQLLGTAVQAVSSDNLEAPAWGGRQQ
jgi:hypothetical protein